MKNHYVLDAWAILALLQKEEPAATRVNLLFKGAINEKVALSISIINLGEVFYSIGKLKGEHEALDTLRSLRVLPIDIIPGDEKAVFAAAKCKTRHSISYADAFAAAAAESLDATLVTGDPELKQIENLIKLEWLERN